MTFSWPRESPTISFSGERLDVAARIPDRHHAFTRHGLPPHRQRPRAVNLHGRQALLAAAPQNPIMTPRRPACGVARLRPQRRPDVALAPPPPAPARHTPPSPHTCPASPTAPLRPHRRRKPQPRPPAPSRFTAQGSSRQKRPLQPIARQHHPRPHHLFRSSRANLHLPKSFPVPAISLAPTPSKTRIPTTHRLFDQPRSTFPPRHRHPRRQPYAPQLPLPHPHHPSAVSTSPPRATPRPTPPPATAPPPPHSRTRHTPCPAATPPAPPSTPALLLRQQRPRHAPPAGPAPTTKNPTHHHAFSPLILILFSHSLLVYPHHHHPPRPTLTAPPPAPIPPPPPSPAVSATVHAARTLTGPSRCTIRLRLNTRHITHATTYPKPRAASSR